MLVSKSEFEGEIPTEGWKKSSYSDNSGPVCLELARVGDTGAVAMRDSTAPNGPVLGFTKADIEAFHGGAKDGEFDYLIA